MATWTIQPRPRYGCRWLFTLALGLGAATPGFGQADSLTSLTRRLERYQQAALPEKLFLHLDRPLYLSGETMWFKVYATEGTHGRPLALSTVAYVEVLDKDQRPVLQGKVALREATGHGSFVLPAALASGTYTVRAYTRWMKNFGPETYFRSAVTVVNTTLPSGAAARDSAAYDAQFFPEGGHLLGGSSHKVAFKVTDHTGRGVAATGRVLDATGHEVAAFQTLRLGMGSFGLVPQPGMAYTAVLTLPDRRQVRRPLPVVEAQGYALALDAGSATQLVLTARTGSQQPETVYLLAHSRQHTAVAAQATLANGRATFVVEKSRLLPGVSHFTLFNAARQPVCERLYFQPPAPAALLTARADKAQYTTRDKVSVQVAATQPALSATSLSMAVYQLDSLNTTPGPDIAHYLWLSSELKGRVENPEFYFTATGPEAAEAADNLMLTQGWSRFRWADVLAPAVKPFNHLPEFNGPVLQARLTRPGTDQPCPEVTAYLASPGQAARLGSARSNATGLVQFEMKHFPGTREIMLQTNPAQDSTCRLTVLDPFSPPGGSEPVVAFALDRRWQRDYARRHQQGQLQSAYAGTQPPRFATQPTDTLAFYGKPDASYLLDKYTRFQVLEEVLREYVPGVMVRRRKNDFRLLVLDKVNRVPFKDPPMVLVDGVPLFDANKVMSLNPLTIRRLDVVTGHYFHGPTVYQGLVSFSTYKGNLEGVQLEPRVLVAQYEGVQAQREFYAPRYETAQEKQSRLPDLRNLLYWNPDIRLRGGTAKTLEFYTGDQAGRYLVVVQGLSESGPAGSRRFVLEVKAGL